MANALKKYRLGSGFTLEELADKVGSSKAYMWQIENKDDPDPGVKLAIKLATAFGISVENLFRDAVKEPEG